MTIGRSIGTSWISGMPGQQVGEQQPVRHELRDTSPCVRHRPPRAEARLVAETRAGAIAEAVVPAGIVVGAEVVEPGGGAGLGDDRARARARIASAIGASDARSSAISG